MPIRSFPAVQFSCLLESGVALDGSGLAISHAIVASPYGDCFIAICELGVCYLGFPAKGQASLLLQQLQRDWPRARFYQDEKAVKMIAANIFSPSENSIVNVLVKGTPFQMAVWQALVNIPPGSTCSYADIARNITRPKACRAVGTAVGRNPVSYLIPCHRVLPQGGGVGNYLWGSAIKQQMLMAEGVLP